MGLSHRMHQTFNNRYNPSGYGSLRVTPIASGLEAPKQHGKQQGAVSLTPLSILKEGFTPIFSATLSYGKSVSP